MEDWLLRTEKKYKYMLLDLLRKIAITIFVSMEVQNVYGLRMRKDR